MPRWTFSRQGRWTLVADAALDGARGQLGAIHRAFFSDSVTASATSPRRADDSPRRLRSNYARDSLSDRAKADPHRAD